MKFKVEINCDNAAFDDNPADEIGRLLHDLAVKAKRGHISISGYMSLPISDVNGNIVGRAWLAE